MLKNTVLTEHDSDEVIAMYHEGELWTPLSRVAKYLGKDTAVVMFATSGTLLSADPRDGGTLVRFDELFDFCKEDAKIDLLEAKIKLLNNVLKANES
jgi:hypothetical protein